ARAPPAPVGGAARLALAHARIREVVRSSRRLAASAVNDAADSPPAPLLRRSAAIHHSGSIRVLDHLRPLLDLGGNESRELVRRAGPRRDRERIHLVLGLGVERVLLIPRAAFTAAGAMCDIGERET